jgi:hypothetical protein
MAMEAKRFAEFPAQLFAMRPLWQRAGDGQAWFCDGNSRRSGAFHLKANIYIRGTGMAGGRGSALNSCHPITGAVWVTLRVTGSIRRRKCLLDQLEAPFDSVTPQLP